MSNKWLYKLQSGKNPKLIYYIVNMFRQLEPACLFQQKLEKILASVEKREDQTYIYERVNYYNKLETLTELSLSTPGISHYKKGKKNVYFYDIYEYIRWFPAHFRWGFCPGDVTFIPSIPSFVKSRPLVEGNQYSIIMKLNKIRHFIFVKDKKEFTDKQDKVIFRGKVSGKECRIRFMEKYFGHPMCDLGDIGKGKDVPQAWKTEKMTIREHLNYKFIMALEGNDVASNLKWVMSSNSIAVMPQPTCETWFMEGKLIPNYHYIEIKPDFSDLEEKINYYISHPEEARRIIDNAHEYTRQFRDEKREKLISLMVLEKYFRMTGQKK